MYLKEKQRDRLRAEKSRMIEMSCNVKEERVILLGLGRANEKEKEKKKNLCVFNRIIEGS